MTVVYSKSGINKASIWIGRSIFFLGLTDLLLKMQGVILFPIFARKLGAYDYGILNLILVSVYLTGMVAELGLGSSMVRYLAKLKERAGLREGFFSIFFTVLLSSVILASLFVISAKPFALGIVGDVSVLLIIQIAALAIVGDAMLQITSTYFTTTRQMKKLAIIRTGKLTFEVVFISGALLLGYGLLGTIIVMVLSRMVIVFINLIIIISQIGFRFPHFVAIRSYLTFGIPLIMVGGFSWVIGYTDRYVIGFFLDATSVGIYSSGHGLGILLGIFAVPIGIVLYPATSKSYDEGNVVEAGSYLSNGLKYYLLFAIPAAFGISVLSGHILSVVGTAEFIPGAVIVPFIAFGTVLMMCFYLIGERVLSLVKRTPMIAASLGFAALMNVALNFLLVPRIGVIGAAIGTLVAYAWLIIPVIISSIKYIKISFNLICIAKSLFSSVIMALIITVIPFQEVLTTLPIYVAIGTLIYFLIMFLIKGFTLQDINYLREIIRSRSKTS